jgi:HAE1 family hydrophobic/amphiphilic exporter-1
MKMDGCMDYLKSQRQNMYNASEISGQSATGYSSGESIKAIQEVAEDFVRGYGIDGQYL